ncbi:hypothetical protein PAAG_06080 [Paracoccidioides lutzii Pb01]|uniref:Uncharacterized protein n=1 Tax=Paracoccidioides lutzii (strain ATCC MYA-826 / Pb01) TaxID=502779 RepID=C1H5X0_PARBA|nr:hypothetical protein PAAG_06080 [Paracoccidioides lutzii Pb01]EEH35033.2 hypothetical protein PAAG_06080 [Paracoccidioides lutzii Pb01]
MALTQFQTENSWANSPNNSFLVNTIQTHAKCQQVGVVFSLRASAPLFPGRSLSQVDATEEAHL